jgi:hypothetical protein
MEIAFSHTGYLKFDDVEIDRKVMLLEVFVAKTSDLGEEFVEYDTTYIERDGAKKNYKLPGGKIIILLLRDYGGSLFTTVRRFTERKYEFYRNGRGKMFDLSFEGI